MAKFEINKQQKTRHTFRWGGKHVLEKKMEVFWYGHFLQKKKNKRKSPVREVYNWKYLSITQMMDSVNLVDGICLY